MLGEARASAEISPLTEGAALVHALARSSRALAETPRLAEGIDGLLAEIGAASRASRVWVFQTVQITDDEVVQDYVFEWADCDRNRQLSLRRFRFFSMTFEDPHYARIIDQRRRGIGQCTHLDDISPGPFHDYIATQQIRSTVAVPIMVDGAWWGTIGIDDCARRIANPGLVLDALGAAAGMIAARLMVESRDSRPFQAELFHKVGDCGVWEIDLSSGSVWCSQGLLRTVGYPAAYANLMLRRLLAAIEPGDRVSILGNLRAAARRAAPGWRQDVQLRTARNGVRWTEIIAEIAYDPDGNPRTISGILIDITHRKEREENALSASHSDALTELLNRRGFDERFSRIPQASAAAEGAETSRPFLFLLDIDGFKTINDRHGHLVGDKVLQILTERIRRVLRQGDAFARFGGDEFAVLLAAVTRSQARTLSERMRQAVAETPFDTGWPVDGAADGVRVTVSIGLASVPDGDDPMLRQAMALAHADHALYAAKRRGRNRAVTYDDMAGAPEWASAASD
ncbi:GGDEF domain-containing protein [Amorphus orientalis]|uniref:diguanylate cyclase n=1 Tax=Amorphus orientalis TaxID=649198 RepID=A0AAE3VRY8_9HYPH|nr:diguanylate cyclase [Amorphus orientalis]MDQ0317284.1 diguanylate cyclase (GGDEF)-like protein [Amorphus orientalis]